MLTIVKLAAAAPVQIVSGAVSGDSSVLLCGRSTLSVRSSVRPPARWR
jgi:hypothetical protein